MIEGRHHEEMPLEKGIFCFHVYLIHSVCLGPTGIIYLSGLNIHKSFKSRCVVFPVLNMKIYLKKSFTEKVRLSEGSVSFSNV
jgi:hypothetical protein